MPVPTEDEYQEMSKAWHISVERLRFLASCPHYFHQSHIRVDAYDGDERHIAKAIHKAIHGSWLPSDAAIIAGVKQKVIDDFIAKHGIVWPPNCRRRLEWGRGTTRTHQLTEEHANLLAKGRITMLEAVKRGISEGLTAAETAAKYGFSSPGMYNTAVRNGMRFISHKDKFGTKANPKTPPQTL